MIMLVLTDAQGRWRRFASSGTLAEESTVDISTPISASLAAITISTFVHVCISRSNNAILYTTHSRLYRRSATHVRLANRPPGSHKTVGDRSEVL